MSEQGSWTIRRVLDWAQADLRTRGSESPRLDAELLLAMVLGTNRIGLIVDSDRPLAPEELSAYRELHKRRRAGEPVAYLRGEREFYGRSFRVDARVLVPRPETEILVEVALRRTRDRSLSARVVDVGTGSGCIAITLAKERPSWKVLAVDASPDALAVARDNALRLGAYPAVAFREGDLTRGLADASLDLVVSNPPYISAADMAELPRDVRDFEPHLALAGGGDGLDVVRALVREAWRVLVPGGVLALEVGAGQAGDVKRELSQAGFVGIEVDKDYAGHERVVSGVRLAEGLGRGEIE